MSTKASLDYWHDDQVFHCDTCYGGYGLFLGEELDEQGRLVERYVCDNCGNHWSNVIPEETESVKNEN